MSQFFDESDRRTGKRRRAGRRLMDMNSEEILESMSDAFTALDREWRYTYVNRAAERITHLPREEMLGRTIWEVFPEIIGSQFERVVRRAMEEGATVHFEEYYAPLDAWLEDTLYPSADGITIYARDVTSRKRTEETLHERERFIHQITELSPVVHDVFDLETERHPYFSSDVVNLLGYTADQIAQMEDEFSMLMHPEDVPRLRENIERLKQLADDEINEFECRVRRGDEWRWMAARSLVFARNERGEVRQVINATLDITERKRAEEALQKAHDELERRVQERTQQLTAINAELIKQISERERAEAELRRSETTLAEGQRLTHTGSGVWNVATDEVVWSQEMYRIYGFEPGSVTPSYELFIQIIHPDDQLRVGQIFQKVVHEEIGYEVEFRIVRHNGQVRHLHSVGHPVYNEAGKLTEVIGTILDITERKQAEEEGGQLLHRLMAAQEEERTRIARQLHDQMGQDVSALGLKLSTLKTRYGTQAELGEQLDSLKVIAKQLSHDIDFLVWELRPTALSDLGLVVALSNYVKTWSKHFNVPAELHTTGMEKDRLTEEIETVLYRVAQEALTNVAKHAGASSVSILLERRSDQVSLIVEDNGIGFDVEQAHDTQRKGVGLIGIRERLILVGGAFEIESEPGNGVTIVARIPAPHVSGGEERNE